MTAILAVVLCTLTVYCLTLYFAAVFLWLIDKVRAWQEASNLDAEIAALLYMETGE